MHTNLKPISASRIASLLIVFNQLTAFQEVAILCKAQPHHALLGYPFHNTATHMEAMLTREGI